MKKKTISLALVFVFCLSIGITNIAYALDGDLAPANITEEDQQECLTCVKQIEKNLDDMEQLFRMN